MEYSLKDKVVLVTGGANGIGYEIVDKYLEQNVKVAIILDVDEERGNEAVKVLTNKYGAGKADFIKCDVTKDLEAVSEMIISKYITVDVLVFNAGILAMDEPRKAIDVYLTSVIEWSMKFLEYMSSDKGGNGGTFIINSSIFGYRTVPFAPLYQAAKFGVLGYAKSLGHEDNFRKTGVRVVAMCPGFTETNLFKFHDPEFRKQYPDQKVVRFIEAHPWQKVEAVGRAAVEIFNQAKSGSVWVIEGDKLTELF